MPVAEIDQDKTAFVCHAGLFRLKRMPLGLINAPEEFQRALDIVLANYKCKACLVYFGRCHRVPQNDGSPHRSRGYNPIQPSKSRDIATVSRIQMARKRVQLPGSPHQAREGGNGTGSASCGTRGPATWTSNKTTRLSRLVQCGPQVCPAVIADRNAAERTPEERAAGQPGRIRRHRDELI